MRFALVTITFFLENTNDVMQTNEFKLTKGDNGNLLWSVTEVPDSSFSYGACGQIRRDTNFPRRIASYLATSDFQGWW